MKDFAVVNGRLIDPASGVDGVRTLVVKNGVIAAIEERVELPADMEVIDAAGLWVLPGLVDIHVHLREPGDEHKETIASGAKSAVAGGFTTVVHMPNTKPVIDNAALVHFVKQKSQEAGLAKVLPSAATTLGQKGKQLTEFAELKEAGAVVLTDDGLPIADAGVMRRALEYARGVDLPIMVHEEEPALSGGSMHEGAVSARLGLQGIPFAAEDVMVTRDIALSELTGGRLHIGHISTKGAVRAVRDAKERGLNVTAEVTPHHLTLTDERVGDYDTHAKMAPPLRGDEDVEACIEGLADGTIDAIATDHAPHATVDKEVQFDCAANGIIGLETSLGLTLKLVNEGRLSLTRAIDALTFAPSRVFGLESGTLRKGAAADFVLVDPKARWTVQAERFFSKSKNSPYVGWELEGQALKTFVDGRLVYDLANAWK